MDLRTIADKQQSVTFDFDGESVTMVVLPHKITPEYRARLAALAKKATASEAEDAPEEKPEEREQDAQMVSDLVRSWDIVMGGEPFPPTYENLLVTPVTVLGRVSSEIMEVIKGHASPTPKTKSGK